MSGAAAGHDGGGATAKHEADDGGGATEKHEADDGGVKEAKMFIKIMLQRLFGYVLDKVHGTKFYEGKAFEFSDLLSAIKSCTGASLTTVNITMTKSGDAFNAFCDDRKMIRYTAFHGTTWLNAKNIFDVGVNPDMCEVGRFGKGFYVANTKEGTVALMHADTDDETITSDSKYAIVVCAVAGPPAPTDFSVGSEMQEDFGVLQSNGKDVLDPSGKPFVNHILTDPPMAVFCVNDGSAPSKAVWPRAVFEFSFSLDEPPTDEALLHSWYPYRLWEHLQVLYPDTRARSVALKKKYVARQRWNYVNAVLRKQVRADKRKKAAARARWQYALRVITKQVRAKKLLAPRVMHARRPVTRSQTRVVAPH